ncbi:M1 family metallopeptidase [Niabella beijingensis]|uniref:M1 family metallopeptidase n=1 Tax=Niabella beijingensis TaxID=2872700 RepID=UPI001CC0929A|nr:M1 family metallopeptidase [Niabella beijingensis]MBZ4190828.1 M1 family metallopeptidase [Niabella beijingensis]
MIFAKNIIKTACCLLLITGNLQAQLLNHQEKTTRQDSLRGSYGAGRDWWNVLRYEIQLKVNIAQQSVSGYNDITYTVIKNSGGPLQIDLQQPMEIEKVEDRDTRRSIPFKREGNVFWLNTGKAVVNKTKTLRVYFRGNPIVAQTPPWDGGWIFTKDSLNRPWISTATQGIGASTWLPCKDHQADEPDKGITVTINVPDELTAVSNGRLTSKTANGDGTTAWKWTVTQPINTYLITPYIGHYVNFNDTLQGEKGTLDIGYWVLDYNLPRARKHFEIVKPMLHCFEYWMGPYPFYEDSYKLVDAPHLGMEHQSGVAYGNRYLNGYLGNDRSGTGWGSDWDFIIVHESGHEWFANNITTRDIADMWVHEAFTTYSETLFVQCRHGLQAANAYVAGQRKNIRNDKPITGPYGVNKEGSSDMYDKGASMIHIIRQLINDDSKFRNLLRGLNRDFYHQTVTGKQIENYILQKTGKPLQKIFDQYLRSTSIPVLTYSLSSGKVRYKWTNCVPGFNMPVQLANGQWLNPGMQYREAPLNILKNDTLDISPNFYIRVEKAS